MLFFNNVVVVVVILVIIIIIMMRRKRKSEKISSTVATKAAHDQAFDNVTYEDETVQESSSSYERLSSTWR